MNPKGFSFIAAAALIVLGVGREASAQLDPLLFIKRDAAKPNILLAVETGNRMQRDSDNHYRDPNVYTRTGAAWETSLGMSLLSTAKQYRRRYINLVHTDISVGEDRFAADRIEAVTNEATAAFSAFDELTRLAIARNALREAVSRNAAAARFGLLRMRQNKARLVGEKNEGPVRVSDPSQATSENGTGGKWSITRPEVASSNASAPASGADGPFLINVDAAPLAGKTANEQIVERLGLPVGDPKALTPGGRDGLNLVDAPVDNMLDDLITEASRLFGLDSPSVCRNTVAVLVVGGSEGTSTAEDPAAKARQFLNVAGHRVPVYVIAVAPKATEVAELQAIATNSGGVYTEITAAMVARTTPGQPVPELVAAVNRAVQHAFVSQTLMDVAPTPELPTGSYAEYQVTSPIVGTVDLFNAPTLDPSQSIVPDGRIEQDGKVIPQRSNVLITTGFRLPGFDGRMRASRMYKPVADSSAKTGYKFVADGTPLWIGHLPAASSRNIFTALPDGRMIPFNSSDDSVDALRSYLRVSDPSALIEFVRNQPLGAIVSSTPALMDPPSLDPPPDATYPGFAAANKNRRTIVWVGANDGMLHALDARLGLEVWAFIPFNLLPKLKELRSGQPVGDFRYFVDSSPKVADVKVGDEWRTYLIMGEGAGGTFYQTFDVTLDDIGAAVDPTNDSTSLLLGYFAQPDAVPLKWAFPRYSSFDATLAPWGDIAESAPAIEKTVGETWSDPAVGQIEHGSGKFAVLTGSGFFKYTSQEAPNRGGVIAGTTFYVLDIVDGKVLASRDVGHDNTAEKVDNCAAANNCTQLKNALQADPVATGPPNSRFINKVYIGDLDGRLWRLDLRHNAVNVPEIYNAVNLLTGSPNPAGAAHPLFASMATVNIGNTKQYLLQGTGSDLLPSNGVNQQYKLLIVLDNGASGTASSYLFEKTDGLLGDEKITSFPAVAGDIVFFTTTTYYPGTPCTPLSGSLYAVTFLGGAAYDTNNDGKLDSKDSAKVKSTTSRATAPFITDQHLVFGSGDKVEMFGDPSDFNNGVGQVGVRILSWREVR